MTATAAEVSRSVKKEGKGGVFPKHQTKKQPVVGNRSKGRALGQNL